MELIFESAEFIATGAAWGMLWLAGFGLLSKSFSNGQLLQLLIFVFIISAGITAYAIFKDLYAEYSNASASMKETILARYKGKDGWILIAKLAVIASPILFLLKPAKSLRVVVAIVATSYVLIPYHQKVIEYFTK